MKSPCTIFLSLALLLFAGCNEERAGVTSVAATTTDASYFDERTWTNQDGQTIVAKVVGVEGEVVVFSRAGQTYRYPIASLTAADQQIVRTLESAGVGNSPVGAQLNGRLLRASAEGLRPVPVTDLTGKRLFAFYYSASWCGPCREFTPELVRFYNEVSRWHPEFELILISADRDAAQMERYMRDYRIGFPVVSFEQRAGLDIAANNQAGGIPHLVLLDGSGKTISRSWGSDNKAPPHVLADIRRQLGRW